MARDYPRGTQPGVAGHKRTHASLSSPQTYTQAEAEAVAQAEEGVEAKQSCHLRSHCNKIVRANKM